MTNIRENREKVEQILVNEWQYKENQVAAVVDKILAMNSDILIAFESWLNDGVVPTNPVFTGCSPYLLSVTYPIKPPAAFLLLDWISREPLEAMSALKDEYGKYPEPEYDEDASKKGI